MQLTILTGFNYSIPINYEVALFKTNRSDITQLLIYFWQHPTPVISSEQTTHPMAASVLQFIIQTLNVYITITDLLTS